MNRSTAIKITLDIILVTLLLILMDTSTTGTNIHEWIGFGIFILFLIHVYLNRSFIKQVIHNLGNKAVGLKPKLMLLISCTLLLCITAILVTGLFISPNYAHLLGVDNFSFWFPIHISISSFTLLLASVHLGLHWKAIFNMFKKGMGMVKTTKFQNVFLKGTAILVTIAGLRGMEQTQIISQAFLPFSNTGKDQSVVLTNPPIMREEQFGNREGYRTNDGISSQQQPMSAEPLEKTYTLTFTGHSGKHGFHKHERNDESYEYNEYDSNDSFFEEETDNNQNDLGDSQVQPDTTLEETLQNTNCTMCEKGCNLLNPECGKGYRLQQQIINQYQNTQGNQTEENAEQKQQPSQYEQSLPNESEGNPFLDEWGTPKQGQPFSDNERQQEQQNNFSEQIDDEGLEDLLNNTICTLCDKGCTLLNPRCDRGAEQAQAVISQYNESNGDTEAIQTELATLSNKQNTDSPILDYMMSMGLVVTSTYYVNEALTRRKRRKS